MELASNNERGLATVRRALSLLEWVSACAQPPSIKECAKALELNLTTTYHLVNTLTDMRYLVKDGTRRLRIGPQVAVLYSILARSTMPSRELVLPLLERLRASTSETCYLSTWEHREVVMQVVLESPQTLRVSGLYPGSRGPAYCRASGKAMLAFISDQEREQYLAATPLRPVTSHTITNPDALRRDLEATRARGYSIDQEEFEDGVCCVAVPFFDVSGSVRGAISVSMPTFRAPLMGERIRPHVTEAGQSVSRLLGYAGPYPAVAGDPTRIGVFAQAGGSR